MAKKINTIVISDHGSKRIHERLNVKKKSIQKVALDAYHKGIPHSETVGRLNSFCDKEYAKSKTQYKTYGGLSMKLYRNILFLFTNQNVLITVIPVPGNLQKQCSEQYKRYEKKTEKEYLENGKGLVNTKLNDVNAGTKLIIKKTIALTFKAKNKEHKNNGGKILCTQHQVSMAGKRVTALSKIDDYNELYIEYTSRGRKRSAVIPAFALRKLFKREEE